MRVLSKVGLAIGKETTPGTYRVPTQTIKVEKAILPDVEFDTVEIPNQSFYGGTKDSVTIADWGRAKVSIESSLYKDFAMFDTLFAISNLKKTPLPDNFADNPNGATDADTNSDGYVLTPYTMSTDTASIDLVLPDRKFKLKGAKANFKMSGKVGDRVQVAFDIQAAYEERVMGAQTIVDVPGTEILFVRRLGGMTLNGVNVNLSEFSFDMGNDIKYEKFTNVGEFHISDYNPKLTLKMRLEDGGADGFDEFKNGTSMDFVADFKDVNGKVIYRLKIPRAKLSTQPKFADQDGIFVIDREFKALSATGDDNFELYYFA